MAFPTTPTLDNFTGADENPIATNWSGPTRPLPNGGQLQRLSNELARGDAGAHTNFMSYYDQAIFGPDCEVYLTVTNAIPTNDSISVTARIVDPSTSSVDFYQGSYTEGTGWRAFRVNNNVYTQLGATQATPTMQAGDGIGMELIDDALNLYHRSGAGGPWSLVFTRTASVVVSGFIGVEIDDSVVRADSFGGGNPVTAGTTDVLTGWRGAGLRRR